ncbi:unnamed protein product [Paramecium primaurelia]|uniref:glycerol kinase n=1 Tax=Paramecium primaurelia TaxID=5886 RepID=A0A8S1NPH5_PARPR|nr:unnamed protein product [Paramecium primaurelia]
MQSVIGSIDSSTTGTRFTICNLNGEQLSYHYITHKQITPHQGWLEHDPIEILNNTIECIKQAHKKMNGVHKLVTIGVTNQRETVVAWNKNTAIPYMNAIVWSDTRTHDICQEYLNKYPKNYFQQKTGLPINTYFSSYKLQWMIQNNQTLKDDINQGNVLFGTIDCWLVWNLTREQNHLTDVTNASRTNLMNLHTLQWDDELLNQFNISKGCLPQIKASNSNFGTLKIDEYEGVPINCVLGDQQAAAIGHALFHEGDCKNTQGSGLFIMANIGQEIKISEYGLLTTVLYQKENEKPIYAFEGAVESGGQLFNWAKDKLQWFDNWEQLSQSTINTEDNGGVYIVPAFSGLFTPFWNFDATGTIIGLSYYTTKDHLRRAILESVCYRTKDVIKAMELSGIKINKIHVDGGLTKNKELMQLQADITQKKLVYPEIIESTASGAAMFAGVGLKLLTEQQIIQNMKVQQIYEGKKSYDKQYKQWELAVNCALQFKKIE